MDQQALAQGRALLFEKYEPYNQTISARQINGYNAQLSTIKVSSPQRYPLAMGDAPTREVVYGHKSETEVFICYLSQGPRRKIEQIKKERVTTVLRPETRGQDLNDIADGGQVYITGRWNGITVNAAPIFRQDPDNSIYVGVPQPYATTVDFSTYSKDPVSRHQWLIGHLAFGIIVYVEIQARGRLFKQNRDSDQGPS